MGMHKVTLTDSQVKIVKEAITKKAEGMKWMLENRAEKVKNPEGMRKYLQSMRECYSLFPEIEKKGGW